MKNVFLFLSALMTLSMPAIAGIAKLEPGTRTIEKINVAKSATVTVDGNPVVLESVGAGLRVKVRVLEFNVYVANLLVDAAPRFVRTPEGALDSLENINNVLMHMTFKRDVDAADVQVSFRDALTINKVDISKPEIKAFLAAVTKGGSVDTGTTLAILLHKNSDGSEVLTYEDSNGKVTTVKGDKGLTHSVMSIWLGNSNEKEMKKLKEALISGN